jgi:hypothetical protein
MTAFDDHVLLVTAFGDDGRGGLFAYDGAALRQIDTLSSTGIAIGHGRIARLLRAADNMDSTSELLVYDERGVLDYRRLDALRDGHDVAWHDGALLVVSSAQNAIWELTPSGELVARWRPTTIHDSWHPNCVASHAGRLWVTCFGRFTETRGWHGDQARGTGLLIDVETGDEYHGLSHPHSPRHIDGAWWVCSSLDLGVVRLDDATRRPAESIPCEGYPRGMDADGDLLFIGVSRARSTHVHANACVAVHSRRTGRQVDVVEVPALEIYDVRFAPSAMLAGLQRGFDTNLQRVAETGARDLLRLVRSDGTIPAALGLPLPVAHCRITVELDQDIRALEPGQAVHRTVRVTNEGPVPLASVPPYPVSLSYRWFDEPGAQSDGPRVPIGGLQPGDTGTFQLAVRAPESPGTHRLSITLVQELVQWFDDVDATNSWTNLVRVWDGRGALVTGQRDTA